MAAYPSAVAAAFRSPRRITITITMPHHAYLALQERCDDEGRSLSNLAAYLLETALVKGG
ncbi:hypothetical protein NZK27_06420 [Synechococcus sp. FGCU-3]|nr:hypothetical protein [Synechococcus sp. FGCU3]